MESGQISSFQPVIASDAKVLVLGSIPSVKSLKHHQYYGNPRNHFWPILYGIFGNEPEQDYDDRIRFLKKKRIALWDVIRICRRQGSLDANIKDEETNDILGLLNEYPNIRLIICNGTKAYQLFKKEFGIEPGGRTVLKLPSTSPIPGKHNKNFEEKMQEWSVILDYLD